ncbi:MAG TPA: hypothetical protein PKE05_16195, partial [Microthrixaceae bacterium]|nr:hypothetical protein [Microthrixaceae bacterium]
PPPGSYMAATGHDLMAADSSASSSRQSEVHDPPELLERQEEVERVGGRRPERSRQVQVPAAGLLV